MSRPPCALLIAMIGTMLAPTIASSQAPPPKPGPAAREDAVIACLTEVRQSRPHARLDAYVTTRGPVHLSGGEQEQARFRECLRQRGYTLEEHHGEWSPAKK